MFERYTDRARRAIDLASQAVWDMGHAEADTGHLLVGLISEGGGVASQALTMLGVTPGMIREAVWNRHPGGTAAQPAYMKITPPLKKALELAERESVRMGCNYVATEHLLLGLIAEGGDTGAIALADCAGLDVVRAKVLELVGVYAGAGAARNVTPSSYAAVMTEDTGEEVASLLPDLPDPPSFFALVVTIPGDEEGAALPLAPCGGAVSSEITLRMPLRAKTLPEAMILAAALGGWTKIPGARAEVGPA